MKIRNILNIIVILCHLSLRLDFWSTLGFVYHLSYVANSSFAAVSYFFQFCHLNQNHDEKQQNENYNLLLSIRVLRTKNYRRYLKLDFSPNLLMKSVQTKSFNLLRVTDHKINSTTTYTLLLSNKNFLFHYVCKKF